jgi:hypothetical protein
MIQTERREDGAMQLTEQAAAELAAELAKACLKCTSPRQERRSLLEYIAVQPASFETAPRGLPQFRPDLVVLVNRSDPSRIGVAAPLTALLAAAPNNEWAIFSPRARNTALALRRYTIGEVEPAPAKKAWYEGEWIPYAAAAGVLALAIALKS